MSGSLHPKDGLKISQGRYDKPLRNGDATRGDPRILSWRWLTQGRDSAQIEGQKYLGDKAVEAKASRKEVTRSTLHLTKVWHT